MKHSHTRVKSSEIVNDDITIDVNLWVEACFIRKSASIASWMQKRKEIFDITEQRIVSNFCQCRSEDAKGKSNGKVAKNRQSDHAKSQAGRDWKTSPMQRGKQ